MILDYPEKYKRLLKNDEEVIWHEKGKLLMSKMTYIISTTIITTILVVLITIGLLKESTQVIPYAIFLIAVIAIIRYNYNSNNLYYLATTDRIIFDRTPHSKFQHTSYYYRNIYKISGNYGTSEPGIALHLNPVYFANAKNENHTPVIRKPSQMKETLAIIRNAWVKKYPYRIFNEHFEPITRKYDLEIEDFNPNDVKQKMIVHGTVKGMEVSCQIGYLNHLQMFKVRINCPNAERNYLRIKRENVGTQLGKIVGLQDLKTGNKQFDDLFLLQSDHEHFFETIMHPNMREMVKRAILNMDWEITMGIEPTSSKKKKTTQDDASVLDAHLLSEIGTTIKRDESFVSPLILSCDYVHKHTTNYKVIAKQFAKSLEMMIALALEIKAYNDR